MLSLFDQYAHIRRQEWPKAILLSLYFFLVIATYWVLKPLKRGVLINHFGDDPLRLFGFTFPGAESEQIGKILNVIAVYFVLVLFTWLTHRLRRHYLILVFAAVFSTALVFYARFISVSHDAIVWSFYVFGDMFNTAMVVLFWAFSNDVATPEEARRTYGIIGLGGVLGGFLGATVVRSWVTEVGRSPLLLLCIVPMVLIVIIAFRVHRMARDGRVRETAVPAKGEAGAALEGARLVFRSKYLLALAAMIALYEVVSNIIDFQLASTVERLIEAPLEKDAFFGLVGQIIGAGSILVQVLLTTFVIRRCGVRFALLFLPVAILSTSAGFLVLPGLFFAAAMSAGDNALNYSIHQSAKENLYVPTSEAVTYRAKAFIDMFVQRFGKVVSVALNLVMVTWIHDGVRWLSLATLGIGTVWLLVVRYLGRSYREKSRRGSKNPARRRASRKRAGTGVGPAPDA